MDTAPDSRHWLVISSVGEDWHVEHPECCATDAALDENFGPFYLCGVGSEITNCGLDSLDVDWKTLNVGRYEISHWVTRHDTAYGPEWDGGLTLVARSGGAG